MMRQIRIYGFVAVTVISTLLLAAGCAGPEKKAATAEVEPEEVAIAQVEPEQLESPATLALKLTPEDSTTYKVIIETQKSIKWEGPTSGKPSAFKGGRTGNTIETTFTQQIRSVDDEGNAVAKITIDGLKFLQEARGEIRLDFDSSNEEDLSSPLAKLIGQSYTVEITPLGEASKVIDASDARAAVRGNSPAEKAAVKLLSDDVIKERHTIPALPPADKEQLRPGENWSRFKNFSFDLMGAKSYEKIYTLEEIKETDGHRVAIAQMHAVPSAEQAKELHEEQSTSFFTKMFDNTEEYTGELKLDLTDGKVAECHEKLWTEWVIVDPGPRDQQEPAALRLTANRLYSIERID